MAVSVLVIVEMFNALNALSENESLVHLPPWSNPFLVGAIALSVLLHCLILYVPSAAILFSVTGLTWNEWIVVLYLSFPVIVLDEILKFVTRKKICKTLIKTKSLWRGGERMHESSGKSF